MKPFTNCAVDFAGPFHTIKVVESRESSDTFACLCVFKPTVFTWRWHGL